MKRIALVLALVAAAPVPPRSPDDARRYRDCLIAARDAPPRAIELGQAWRLAGGGLPAQHCLALGLVADGKPAQARAELERAGRAADLARDPLAAELWGQAGNAALLGGDPAGARALLTTALDRGESAPTVARVGWLIDRARAAVAAGDLPPARADLDRAIALDPADPTARLLSAALAGRMGDVPRARRDAREAKRLAPGDPAIAAASRRADDAYFDGPAARAAQPLGTIPPPY